MAQATYPKVGRTEQARFPSYLVLLRVGFAMPRALLRGRCALTAPFHPYPGLAARAVCFLLRFPSAGFPRRHPGRYPAHCSMEFGLSSDSLRRQRSPGPIPTINIIDVRHRGVIQFPSMRLIRLIAYWLLLLPCAGVLVPQESLPVIRITAAAAQQNVIKRVEPAYPQLAKVARVQGRVIVGIVISPEGKVASERALSGHPILIQSAMDAVRLWEFRPYILEGRPRAVTALVRVAFSLGHT